ncbi:MAG: NAD+ synthase, partial [Steroidobacteraceae bacterium]|nr:NAD+ synthase [Steroidobacteraceae bacterium]
MSGAVLRLALAQLNLLVGDIAGNAEKIRVAARRAQQEFGADLVICPELALSGYPPEDLLFHRGFRRQIGTALERFAADPLPTGVLFGYPEYAGTRIFNAAALFDRARLQATHRKACLPNYKVFDEKRYFEPGGQPAVADFRGFRLGLLICEDIWEPEPAQLARSLGAEVLLVINASPFEIRKQLQRETVLRERIADVGLPIVYVNLVGGQDELVF